MQAASGATPGRGTFAALADQVRAAAPRLGVTRLVCVDGPAGSGKTRFAGRLAAELGAPVLHMDDVYAGWTLTGGFARLAAGVLRPLREGRAGAVHRYDWPAGRFAELVHVPAGPALVVEGCGSAPRDVDPYAVLRVWVEAPRTVRIARGIARDGEALRAHWLRWQQQEAAEFAGQDTRARADLLIDGTAGTGEREYALLRDGRG
ncbi:uridine kinase family protein [Modestobacter excelsi]|uniref:uridine kinase family protein n=1 Tax=Modestobacter excelsi TaxID=2213161 RepID=UPI00110CBEA9|nr:uridine kinase [Modestobacter excelsi]